MNRQQQFHGLFLLDIQPTKFEMLSKLKTTWSKGKFISTKLKKSK